MEMDIALLENVHLFQQQTKWHYSFPHWQMAQWKCAQHEKDLKTPNNFFLIVKDDQFLIMTIPYHSYITKSLLAIAIHVLGSLKTSIYLYSVS